MLAAASGNFALVKKMLETVELHQQSKGDGSTVGGFDLEMKCKNGKTAYDYAGEARETETSSPGGGDTDDFYECLNLLK